MSDTRKDFCLLGPVILLILLILSLPGPVKAAQLLMEPNRQGGQRECLECHGYPNTKGQEGVRAQRAFCLECHQKEIAKRKVDGKEASLVVKEEYFKKNPHRYVACLDCHKDVPRSPHRSSRPVACLDCHTYHKESTFLPSHVTVRCEACHFEAKELRPEPGQKGLVLAGLDRRGELISYSRHLFTKDLGSNLCMRCHTPQSQVPGADHVLNGKGIICLACHYSGLGFGNWIWGLAFVGFFLGIFGTLYIWMKGSVLGAGAHFHEKLSILSEKAWSFVWSREIFRFLKIFFLDVILERRLLQESVRRWVVHTLIYWGFLFKLCLSIITFIFFALSPSSVTSGYLINKDSNLVAFLNDFFGICILSGIGISLIQKLFSKSRSHSREFQDFFGILMLGLTVASGFFLEALRFKLTLHMGILQPWAFMGYILSQALVAGEMGLWQSLYTISWYVHSTLWAILVVWIPLGKLRHMLFTPVTLIHEGLKK